MNANLRSEVAVPLRALNSNTAVRIVAVVLSIAGLLRPATAQQRVDLVIPLPLGDTLDATYYVPPFAPPPDGYPALIFVHGFGLNKDWDTLNCLVYAQKGYLALCYSVRGHGNSTGLSTIISTRERADFHRVVGFTANLPLVDANAVGVIGGSQGGAHALWAAMDQLSVAAVTADVITPLWASDMFDHRPSSFQSFRLLLPRISRLQKSPIIS